jgi:hypothetical protein
MERLFITPPMAGKFLEKNVNRNVRWKRVEKMARDIANGEWRETHQAIAFNCDGSLKDGQHRLQAIVKAGTGLWLWVATGLQDDAMMHIDTHAPRSDVDAFKLLGDDVDRNFVAVAKQMYVGPTRVGGTSELSREGLRLFLQQHNEAIEFACHGGARAKVGQSAVRGVIARGYYHVDHGRLQRFRDILLHGPDDAYRSNADSAVIRLREHLLGLPNGGGSGFRVAIYQRSQAALSAFAESRPLTKLYARSENLFPLPTN